MRLLPRLRVQPSALAALVLSLLLAGPAFAQDRLPSWNDSKTKQAILDFVNKVTGKGGADYVPPAQRIAVFDNDGTLWTEQPIYVQFAFALDRVKALAPQHPEWKDTQPFKAVLEGDMPALAAAGEKGLVEILVTTHAGMSTEEFERIVKDWLATARHPRFKRPYTELVYQPMLELLAYLRANGFKTSIVSGGGVEFVRVWTEKVYGIPPEQVVGSSGRLKYVFDGGAAPNWAGSKPPVLERLPEINFVDDNIGKPVGIQQFIGRRPILAVGNSDGDKEMLGWTAAGSGVRFMGLVYHTDATREYAYDRDSKSGRLDKALKEKLLNGMKVGDKTFKNHLDGYNFMPYLKGQVAKGPRHEFFYFTDNGDLTAVRYDDWKVTFKTIKGNLFTGTEESTNVPLVTNLRQDPWERYQDQSMMYARWWGDKLWTLIPSAAIVGQFLQTFREYPPSQTSGTFGIEKALQMIEAGSRGGGK